MGYEADLSSHYASVRRRLLGPEKQQRWVRLVEPEPPEPEKPHSVTIPPPPPPVNLGLKPLFIWVCEREGFKPAEVHSDSRKGALPLVRQIFSHLAYFRKQHNTSQIGRFLKNDHTTVIHSVNRIVHLRTSDKLLNERLTRYERAIDLALNVGGEEHPCLCLRCPFRV